MDTGRLAGRRQLDKMREPLTKFTAMVGIGLPLVTIIMGGTVAWANTQTKLIELDAKVLEIERDRKTLKNEWIEWKIQVSKQLATVEANQVSESKKIDRILDVLESRR